MMAEREKGRHYFVQSYCQHKDGEKKKNKELQMAGRRRQYDVCSAVQFYVTTVSVNITINHNM